MNKYEIKGIVGEGAYGIVYQARHKETGEIGKDAFIPPVSPSKLVDKLITEKFQSYTNHMVEWLLK